MSLLSRNAGCGGRAGMGDGAGLLRMKCSYASLYDSSAYSALFIFSG